MESGTEKNLDQPQEPEKESSKTLEAKVEELKNIKEELKRAKDNATESWLDSKPLIDELEKLKSDLETAQNGCSMSNNVISELESQLETIVMAIRAKREEELRATKMANEMNRALEQTREELEHLKADKAEEHRARSNLKQTLRLRRQALRTLQLTIRAVRMESEAFGASAAEALRYINHPDSDNSPVQLTQEDYYTVKRRAKEETSLADWRVSVAIEQKVAAEAGRNLALSKLKDVHRDGRSLRRRKAADEIVAYEEKKPEEPPVDEVVNRGYAFPKARAKAMAAENKQGQRQWMRRTKSRKNEGFKKKKKVSIFWRIKICLGRIKGMFR